MALVIVVMASLFLFEFVCANGDIESTVNGENGSYGEGEEI